MCYSSLDAHEMGWLLAFCKKVLCQCHPYSLATTSTWFWTMRRLFVGGIPHGYLLLPSLLLYSFLEFLTYIVQNTACPNNQSGSVKTAFHALHNKAKSGFHSPKSIFHNSWFRQVIIKCIFRWLGHAFAYGFWRLHVSENAWSHKIIGGTWTPSMAAVGRWNKSLWMSFRSVDLP